MSRSKLPFVAALLCGTLLLMAGVVPAGAQSDTPTPANAEAAQPAAVDSAPNMLISYQGTLRDSSGNLVNDGAGVSHTMIVQIYDTVNGSNSLWGPETHSGVVVHNGHFSLLMGSVTTMSANLFSGKDRFLKLTVDGTALTPLQRLASVPYAVSSNYANSLAAPDGDPLDPISAGDDGNVTVKNPYSLNFGSTTRQMLNLWSTGYAIGVQSYTQYFRSGSDFAWYVGGAHSDVRSDPGTGGKATMLLNGSGNLGIGTTGPDKRLTIQAADTGGQWLSFKDSTGATKWHLNSYNGTGLNIAESSVADARLFIAAGGNVGIGDATPSAKLDVNGDFMVAGHKPVIFRKFTMTNHCYANFYSNYDANDWACGIVSWKVNGDIDESGKQYPLLGAWTSVRASDNDWVFSVDVGNACGEEWEFTAMCVSTHLVQWDPEWDFPASSSASSVEDELQP